MKKVFCFVVCCIALLAVTSCGNNSNSNNNEGTTQDISVTGADGTVYNSYQTACSKGDFDAAFADCPFNFQDWDSGKREAKRILFVRRADYRNPTPGLFARMANDYEGVLDVMKRHGFLR